MFLSEFKIKAVWTSLSLLRKTPHCATHTCPHPYFTVCSCLSKWKKDTHFRLILEFYSLSVFSSSWTCVYDVETPPIMSVASKGKQTKVIVGSNILRNLFTLCQLNYKNKTRNVGYYIVRIQRKDTTDTHTLYKKLFPVLWVFI